jgi:hypothetical protein
MQEYKQRKGEGKKFLDGSKGKECAGLEPAKRLTPSYLISNQAPHPAGYTPKRKEAEGLLATL